LSIANSENDKNANAFYLPKKPFENQNIKIMDQKNQTLGTGFLMTKPKINNVIRQATSL
jgi:uncharacterized membrane protein